MFCGVVITTSEFTQNDSYLNMLRCEVFLKFELWGFSYYSVEIAMAVIIFYFTLDLLFIDIIHTLFQHASKNLMVNVLRIIIVIRLTAVIQGSFNLG